MKKKLLILMLPLLLSDCSVIRNSSNDVSPSLAPSARIFIDNQNNENSQTLVIKQQRKTISPINEVRALPPSVTATTSSQSKSYNTFGEYNAESTMIVPSSLSAKTIKTTPSMPGPSTMFISQYKEWRAPAGTTLRENIVKWAEETKCESKASTHWIAIWPLSVTDYRLDAPLVFRGSFESTLEQVFELYRTAQKPLYAQASRMQCVIIVSESRDGH